jgi:glycosyltransferase involved in cell wall biosynthesis
MNQLTQCAVVIPCMNEAAAIGALVTRVLRDVPTVFVVDDGSTDNTAEQARSSGARILRHTKNFGKGATLQTGLRQAHMEGFQWALCMDGDGQHSPEDIPTFLNRAERTGAPLIVGNRMQNTSRMPALRAFVNRWMSLQISKLAGCALPDSQCGFRLVHLPTWAAMPIGATHFEIESDMLLAFAAHGYRIDFVPIQVIYKNEQSKIHPVRDTIRWFRWWQRAKRAMAKFEAEKRSTEESIKGTEILKGA